MTGNVCSTGPPAERRNGGKNTRRREERPMTAVLVERTCVCRRVEEAVAVVESGLVSTWMSPQPALWAVVRCRWSRD